MSDARYYTLLVTIYAAASLASSNAFGAIVCGAAAFACYAVYIFERRAAKENPS